MDRVVHIFERGLQDGAYLQVLQQFQHQTPFFRGLSVQCALHIKSESSPRPLFRCSG